MTQFRPKSQRDAFFDRRLHKECSVSATGTRRNFFQRINLAFTGLVAAKFLPTASAAAKAGPITVAPASAPDAADYYDKLGITKTINAAGTYTYLTGCLMPPSVQAAVAQAAKHAVFLEDLQRASGQYVAQKLRCEAAMVTAGAASAVTLGTAACMAVAN